MSISTVFIVEDHPIVSAGLTQLLDRQPDFEVSGQAGCARDALQEVLEARPDLLLVDISLENGSGLEFVKDVRAQDYAGGIVVISAHDELVYAERSLRAGAQSYVMKSAPPERILDALRRVRDGGIVVSDVVNTQLLSRMSAVRGATPLASPLDHLSDRELQVFEHIGRGQSTREIANHLGISIKTVETYRAQLKRKLGIQTGNELVKRAVLAFDGALAPDRSDD